MQHKGLFVALCCGALCLTGCIKNIESESVTKIREATAAKLLSEAELNKAQAAAEKIKADAAATVADAQAKLIEAQAAKEAAEAKLVEAKAELQKIENEIAKVKLDEEREELKRKKAEVEKQIAEYEAAIAWAAASQQAAINMLENLQAQAEIDAIKNQAELLEQEQELVKQAVKLKDDLRIRLSNVWTAYSNALTTFYTKQAELAKAQAELAKIEAGFTTAYEVIADQILAKQDEIALLEAQLEHLEEYATLSATEISLILEPTRQEYVDALNDEMAAKQVLTLADETFNEANALANQDANKKTKLVYTEDWKPLAHIANDASFQKYFSGVQDMEIAGRDYAGVVYKGLFIPLFAGTVKNGKLTPDVSNQFIEVKESYPEAEGPVVPKVRGIISNRVYLPAMVNTENFEDVLSAINEEIDDKEEGDITVKKADFSGKENYLEGKIATLTATLEGYAEYIEPAVPEMMAIKNAMDDAKEDVIVAGEAFAAAKSAIDTYEGAHPAITNEAKAERDAFGYLVMAEEAMNLAKANYFEVVETVNILKAEVKELGDLLYEARLDSAKKKVNIDTLWVKLDPAKTGSLGDKLAKADAAVDEKQVDIDEKEGEIATLLEAYREAEIKYAATEAAGDKTKMEEAKQKWEAAKEELKTLEGELTPLLQAQKDAQDAFDKVNGPYQEGVKAYDDADRKARQIRAQYESKVIESSLAMGKIATAKAQFESAQSGLKTAQDNYKAAHDANLDDSTEEYIALYETAMNATIAGYEAAGRIFECGTELVVLTTETYPYFWPYYNDLDPTFVPDPNDPDDWTVDPTYPEWDKVPVQKTAQLDFYVEKQRTLENELYAELETIHENYNAQREDVIAAEERLAIIEAAEADYLEYIETLDMLWEARNIAQKAYIDAQNATAEVKAIYDALVEVSNLNVYVDQNGVEYTVAQLAELVETKKVALIKANAELEDLYAKLETGFTDPTGKTQADLYAECLAKVKKLEQEIEYYYGLVASYGEELDTLLALINEEMEPID